MSNERHETVADNVSANHQFREVAKMIPHEEVDVSKMETTTSTREKSSVVGNSAKMREALEKIANMGEQIDCQLGSSEETVYAFRNERCIAHNISECARSALSAPPRNCDLGTTKEQSARFDAHCRKHMGCLTCPLREKNGGVPKHCEFAWAQMPYEEGSGK